MIHHYKNIKSLEDFKNKNEQIAILERKEPIEADFFFKKLYKHPFSVTGSVSKENANKDIKRLLNDKIPEIIQSIPFYEKWVNDMSLVCKIFCCMQGEKSTSYWIGSERGCKRYHVDMVPFRLLVTYAGQGTEILPNEAADRNAFHNGKSNNEIIKDSTALRYLKKWDINVFRGGNDGILHRTPDSAIDGSSSILMRLDHSSFLKEIQQINNLL